MLYFNPFFHNGCISFVHILTEGSSLSRISELSCSVADWFWHSVILVPARDLRLFFIISNAKWNVASETRSGLKQSQGNRDCHVTFDWNYSGVETRCLIFCCVCVCHIATPDLTTRRDVTGLRWLGLINNKLCAGSPCVPSGVFPHLSLHFLIETHVSWLQRNYSGIGLASSKAFWLAGVGLSPYHRIKFTEALNKWGRMTECLLWCLAACEPQEPFVF